MTLWKVAEYELGQLCRRFAATHSVDLKYFEGIPSIGICTADEIKRVAKEIKEEKMMSVIGLLGKNPAISLMYTCSERHFHFYNSVIESLSIEKAGRHLNLRRNKDSNDLRLYVRDERTDNAVKNLRGAGTLLEPYDGLYNPSSSPGMQIEFFQVQFEAKKELAALEVLLNDIFQ